MGLLMLDILPYHSSLETFFALALFPKETKGDPFTKGSLKGLENQRGSFLLLCFGFYQIRVFGMMSPKFESKTRMEGQGGLISCISSLKKVLLNKPARGLEPKPGILDK